MRDVSGKLPATTPKLGVPPGEVGTRICWGLTCGLRRGSGHRSGGCGYDLRLGCINVGAGARPGVGWPAFASAGALGVSRRLADSADGAECPLRDVSGETPNTATETVALPGEWAEFLRECFYGETSQSTCSTTTFSSVEELETLDHTAGGLSRTRREKMELLTLKCASNMNTCRTRGDRHLCSSRREEALTFLLENTRQQKARFEPPHGCRTKFRDSEFLFFF
jgi:hypothetical protein